MKKGSFYTPHFLTTEGWNYLALEEQKLDEDLDIE
jgi:hypothetical protein